MSEIECDIRQLVSRLRTAHFKGYLLSQGWEEKPSRYVDQLYFQGKIHAGGAAYELYLPASKDVDRYQTLVMRAIYKLCGIEDREPAEIARDILATLSAATESVEIARVTRLRVRNSDTTALRVQIDAPAREHRILPGEAVELVCAVDASAMLEIEHDDATLIIRASTRN